MTTKRKKSKAEKQLERITGGPITIGGIIKAIREGEKETQVAFAETLGVSRQYLCDLEHGRRLPSPKAAANYAKKLGYSESQFVRLTLQELLDREKINFKVTLQLAGA